MKFLPSIILLLFCVSSNANEFDAQKNLRTLFTTPDERQKLDKLRRQGKYNNQTPTPPITQAQKPVSLKMQGVVIRKNQKSVIFINDSNNLISNKIESDITVKPQANTDKTYIVPIQVNQTHVKLKPGQQWNELDKSVKDTYEAKAYKSNLKIDDKHSK